MNGICIISFISLQKVSKRFSFRGAHVHADDDDKNKPYNMIKDFFYKMHDILYDIVLDTA
jgi:hypothetical protein